MTKFTLSDNKFDDIEMLDIESDSSSLETDSMSDSEISTDSKGSSRLNFNQQLQKLDLQEWLDSDKNLEFEFDEEQYKKSLHQDDTYSVEYTNYVTRLYKIIESLTNNNITRIDLEQEEEAIGLISSSSSKTDGKEEKFHKVDDSFKEICERLDSFMNVISQDDKEYEKFYHLSNILSCLQSTVFCSDIRLKPELSSKWINKFDPMPDAVLVEDIMIHNPQPYAHPLFWNKYITQLVMRGLFDQANEGIIHSKYESLENECPELYLIIKDLQSLLESYSTMALTNKFAQWKVSCCEFRDSLSNFKANIKEPSHIIMFNQIYELVCILTGLPKTISNYSSSWFEIFLGLCLFKIRDDSTVYSEYFKFAIEERPPMVISDSEDDLFKVSEQCFIDIMEENYLKVLRTIYTLDPATASYISKLFELKGCLTNYYSLQMNSKNIQELLNKKTISEYFLISHAYQCLNIHNLAPVGIGLLLDKDISTSQNSSIINRKTVADFLPKYQYKTNDDLEWGLTICAKLNLIQTARELYFIYGNKSLKDGFLFESLNMFVNCYDPDSNLEYIDTDNESYSIKSIRKIHYITWDMIFQDALLNNRPIKDQLINNVVNREIDTSMELHPVIRQCLSPYAVLSGFFSSLNNLDDSNVNAMGKLSKLIHLLRFKHLPKKFYPLLLAQVIPFLIQDKFTFTLPDLIVIIELIDSFDSQVTEEEFKEGESLYQLSINNIKKTERYDWRQIMKENNIDIKKDIRHLILFLRSEIVAKIGQVYINR